MFVDQDVARANLSEFVLGLDHDRPFIDSVASVNKATMVNHTMPTHVRARRHCFCTLD